MEDHSIIVLWLYRFEVSVRRNVNFQFLGVDVNTV